MGFINDYRNQMKAVQHKARGIMGLPQDLSEKPAAEQTKILADWAGSGARRVVEKAKSPETREKAKRYGIFGLKVFGGLALLFTFFASKATGDSMKETMDRRRSGLGNQGNDIPDYMK
jgi:hypothetical protein